MTSTAPLSEAKIEANRANAAHSTGPQTPEGKSRTRLNGLRHGLTGQTVVMPFEDRKAYERHTARIIDALKPAGDLERDLAQSIADDKWRLHRARSIEENLFAMGAEDCAIDYPDADRSAKAALTRSETFVRFAREFQLLTLYESRINRNLKNNTAELTRLQHARKEEEARQLEDAALFIQLAESKGEAYDPASHWQGPALALSHDQLGNQRPPLGQGARAGVNGFAFSPAEIAGCRRRNEARALATPPQNSKTSLKKAA